MHPDPGDRTQPDEAEVLQPQDSASIVLLRDGEAGLEVFLLRRHAASQVHGGAYVFPGGKVDPADAGAQLLACLDRPASHLAAQLGEAWQDASSAAGLYVAAIREAFEESTILFAEGAQAQDVAQVRAHVLAGLPFGIALQQAGMRLHTDALVPWSRWITPNVPSMGTRRFDTRFFVAALPPGQRARHDEHETTEGVWVAPRAALQTYWARAMVMAPPQIMGLAHLSHYRSVHEALQAARRRRPPTIAPESFQLDGARMVCYPGDARHSLRSRALPGPTRLAYRAERFEPDGGFDAFFADPPDAF